MPVRNHFDDVSATLILQMPAPRPDGIDQIIWALDPSGRFSIKSVVGLIQRYRCRCPPNMQEGQRLWLKQWQFDMQDRLTVNDVESCL
ncbi:hypothetical protein CJ030_MR6G008534 [Morella rubra]|uniref:Uncharacterized protein n=1 Tax=Morella rubra TaxID=262757 RepID=A0A6A1VHE0_9ROSI|nr:hypothetical protein CJ030_MR6G008534 [Morella rubra]